VGSPQSFAPFDRTPSHAQSGRGPANAPLDADLRGIRLWLVEPLGSASGDLIEQASIEAGLCVARLDNVESAPANAALVGVGPSLTDPLRVARYLRASGSQALLVFFADTSAARNGLQAELVRDPFVYPRFEIVDLPTNQRQLASRMSKVLAKVQRRLHMRRTIRRGRSRGRASTVVGPSQTNHTAPLLAHVLAQTRDAVLSTDENGRVVTWNEPAARLLGLRKNPSAAQTTVHLTDQSELAELINEARMTGEVREAHVTCVGEQGERTQVLASVAPVRDTRGAHIGATVVLRDDSEYQRIQAALREANRQKDEFLAIMSHELRTPLTSILGYTDMLLRGLSGPLAPMANKYVGNVRSAGDRLLELVNSLLDYTRLESGVERLDVRPVDLRRVVSQVVQMCHSVAENKGVHLRLLHDEGLDATVDADEDRVAHVFRSMLGNALKFTPTGGWVEVFVQPVEDDVRVVVRDSGIGMRSEQIGRVWERFYQGDASLTRPYGGMGLGLSIARHLVTLHGGTVGADSGGPGQGSTFWFSLPRAQPD
jgi:PAS domain S-box-containing protein